MSTTVMNVKVDVDLKREAQSLARSLGIPLSAVVSSSLKAFVAAREITFRDDERLAPSVEAELLQMSADAQAGQWDDFSPSFDNSHEAIAWLQSAVESETTA
ncbi:MAG: hypothetical protein LBV00_13295 [Propionibacteriaceae bacterium]|jgi:antitoxin component of RelBE/YafQ-DinJ toxin-antitoxin module|nr:hypothetical protein [Propionibacteriaceae bacterium]